MDATHALPFPNSYWVLPGRLLAGEYPSGATPALTRERLGRLLEAGIKTFVDLTLPSECEPYDAALPLSIEYLRKPIRDHGLPERREHMVEILSCVQESLRVGRPTYVHCRAGIGRTGTVIGCLLVERGLTAERSLEQLGRLWRQSERSRDWPSVPETEAQREYVRLWTPQKDASGAPDWLPVLEPAPPELGTDPLLDPATLSAAHGLRERFLGAMLGLAVGDAVAASTQFRRPGTFAPVTDMIGGGPYGLPPGGWSDDTAMALCLAESLLERRGFDSADQVERYCRWQREGHLSATGQCLGITAGTARSLAVAQWRQQPFSGSHDPARLDPEPLSRVAPVALFYFASPEQAVRMAGEAARVTCQAGPVLAACADLARMLMRALTGRPKTEILAQGSAKPSRGAPRGAAQALAVASEAFAATESFREAVLHAVNLGGNSDVTAAVCGQLAGAYYGVGAIPPAWSGRLLRRSLIEGLTDRLLAHALMEMG